MMMYVTTKETFDLIIERKPIRMTAVHESGLWLILADDYCAHGHRYNGHDGNDTNPATEVHAHK